MSGMREYSKYPPRWKDRTRLQELARQCRTLVSAFPVIVRELLGESRRPLNYWLRVLAAGVLITVFAFFMLGVPVQPANIGADLFGVLHCALLLSIWIMVPLMTADC